LGRKGTGRNEAFQTQATKNPVERGFSRADDGTRTHDLLHGKQTL
jgi:hypothetical protein